MPQRQRGDHAKDGHFRNTTNATEQVVDREEAFQAGNGIQLFGLEDGFLETK